MRVIGISNIITFLMFLFITFLGCVLFYFTFIESDTISNFPILMYPFIGISFLVPLIVWLVVIFKFKIVIITDKGISCFYPFILKKKQLKWKNLKEIEWSIFSFGKSYYRAVNLKSIDVEIVLTDLEFENFNSLTDKIPNGIDLRKEIDVEQAKIEKTPTIIFIVLISCLGLWILYQNICHKYYLFSVFIGLLTVLLVYLLNKRRIRYSKVLENLNK